MAAFFLGRPSKVSFKNPDSFCCEKCCVVLIDGKLQCDCGEQEQIFDWFWKQEQGVNNTTLSNNNLEVLFHPVYSLGTAAVCGDEKLLINHHYYWEIKVLTCLYGTDVMIGVGTSKINFNEWKTRFCSMLGYDDQSWGYSYHGVIQHDRLSRSYGKIFGLGSLIGVHVDMCKGTLEYYLNRKPLGIAFKGLKKHELYPIVTSTASQSSIKLTCSIILKPTLQLQCLKLINSDQSLIKMYSKVSGLTRLIQKGYFWLIPQENKEKDTSSINLDLEDEAVVPITTLLAMDSKQRKRVRVNKWGLYVKPTHVHISINKPQNADILENPSKRRNTSESDTIKLYYDQINLQLIDNIESIREDINLKNRNINLESNKKGETSRICFVDTNPASCSTEEAEVKDSGPWIGGNNTAHQSTTSKTNHDYFKVGLSNEVFLPEKHDDVDLYSDLTDIFHATNEPINCDNCQNESLCSICDVIV